MTIAAIEVTVTNRPARYVRFYFVVSVSCLIPSFPPGHREAARSAGWEAEFAAEALSKVEAQFSSAGLEIAYRRHIPVDIWRRLFSVEFAVTALHGFSRAQLLRDGRTVRQNSFSKIRKIIASKIESLLQDNFVIDSVVFDYAASRVFVFENYITGTLRLRCDLASSEFFAAAGGSLIEAIRIFNEEVVERLESTDRDLAVDPRTTVRRPRNHIYRFDLFTKKYYSFEENEIVGNVAALTRDMTVEDTYRAFIDSNDDILDELISGDRENISSNCLDLLPDNITVEKFALCYSDSEEGIFNYFDEMNDIGGDTA